VQQLLHRVRRVVHHPGAPDDVVRTDLRDALRVLEVALDRADPRALTRRAGAERRSRLARVEQRDGRGARGLGAEGDVPVDPEHAADVGERPAAGVLVDERPAAVAAAATAAIKPATEPRELDDRGSDRGRRRGS
jgi:hypothetical protein